MDSSAVLILIFIHTLGFIVYTSRPAIQLLAGLTLPYHINPSFIFVLFIYLSVSGKILSVLFSLLFRTYGVKNGFSKFVLIIVHGTSMTSNIVITILNIIYSATANTPNTGNNIAQSPLYCCYFASTAPECGSGTPEYCTSADALSNPKVRALLLNDIFIEHFVWTLIFILLESVWYYLELKKDVTDNSVDNQTERKHKTISSLIKEGCKHIVYTIGKNGEFVDTTYFKKND
jgi:hypothetical protein